MATKKNAKKSSEAEVNQAVDAAQKPRTATDVLNGIYQEVSKFKPEIAVQLPAGVIADLVKIIAMHETALTALAAKS